CHTKMPFASNAEVHLAIRQRPGAGTPPIFEVLAIAVGQKYFLTRSIKLPRHDQLASFCLYLNFVFTHNAKGFIPWFSNNPPTDRSSRRKTPGIARSTSLLRQASRVWPCSTVRALASRSLRDRTPPGSGYAWSRIAS